MHLVSCACPSEPLEDAPRTALLADLIEGEQWDGFWSSTSDAYFVRRTRDDGATEWFNLADDASATPAPADAHTRILMLRPKTTRRSRVAVVVAQSPSGQRMLVGSARRTIR